jgi:hypothetical protein
MYLFLVLHFRWCSFSNIREWLLICFAGSERPRRRERLRRRRRPRLRLYPRAAGMMLQKVEASDAHVIFHSNKQERHILDDSIAFSDVAFNTHLLRQTALFSRSRSKKQTMGKDTILLHFYILLWSK